MVQIRDVIAEELEAAFAGKKPAKAALDDAVARGNALLRQFAEEDPITFVGLLECSARHERIRHADHQHFAVPAKAGIYSSTVADAERWVPAFAGTAVGVISYEV